MRPILVLLIQTVGEERKRRGGRGGEGGGRGEAQIKGNVAGLVRTKQKDL